MGPRGEEGRFPVIFDRILARTANRNRQRSAGRTYVRLVDLARRPEFYTQMGIPDTIDGRFELIVLHAFLILDRLQWRPGVDSSEALQDTPTIEAADAGIKGDEAADQQFAQALFDYMFADMDHNLREMGVGDMNVGKRVRKMGEAFYGRAVNYQRALQTGRRDDLCDALRRNLFGTVSAPSTAAVTMMADYVTDARNHLRRQPSDGIKAAEFNFPTPPDPTLQNREMEH